MYTEEEAKTKWCPFARAHAICNGGTLALNRAVGGGVWTDCRCIASACMAWRWCGRDPLEAQTLGGTPISTKPEKGYCGLGGKP